MRHAIMTLALAALLLGGPAWAAPDQDPNTVQQTEEITMEVDSRTSSETREQEQTSEAKERPAEEETNRRGDLVLDIEYRDF